MIDGTVQHFHHMLHLGGMSAGNKSGAARNELFHGIDRLVHRTARIGFGLEAQGRGGRSLLFRQTIDEIVHYHVSQIEIFTRRMVEVVAAHGKTVPIAAEHKYMQVVARQADPRGKWQGAAMNKMDSMSIYEIRETGGTPDSRQGHYFFMWKLVPFQGPVKGRKHCEIPTSGTPRWMVRGEVFFDQFFPWFTAGRIFNYCGGSHLICILCQKLN